MFFERVRPAGSTIATAPWRALAFALVASLFCLNAPLCAGPASAAPAAIDVAQAGRCIAEVRTICEKDRGTLWGVDLYGAILFQDERSGDVVANRPDYGDRLKAAGSLFVGTMALADNPQEAGVRWGGVNWTVFLWPLPDNPFQRDRLLLHGLFLRVADQRGFSVAGVQGDHLDSPEGRLWTQMEWRALNRALLGPKEARRKALQDALAFRAYRRALLKEGAECERKMELRDGLAEYTAIVLCAKNRAEAAAYAARSLEAAPSYPTFAPVFAEVTGPAYGLLLDDAVPGWRANLQQSDDLGGILAASLKIAVPEDPKAYAEGAAPAYGSKEMKAAEEEMAAKKQKEAEAIRTRFIEGPVLALPTASGFNYAYDSTGKVRIEGWGTVYPFLRVFAAWGTLEATGGALLVVKESVVMGVRVTAPRDTKASPLAGDGWTLTLKPGWTLVAGDRPGDWTLKNTAPTVP